MMRILSAIFLISASVANCEELQNAPGRAVFWSPAESADKVVAPLYRTQSMEGPEVQKLFEDNARKNEIVAMIKSADGRMILTHASVKDSIRSSSNSIVMPNVYKSDRKEKNVLDGSESMKNTKDIDLLSFVKIVQDHDVSAGSVIGPMNNGNLDSYQIILTGHESEAEHMKTIATIASKNANSILFVAIEEPMKNAILPAKSGEYSRVLKSSISSSNVDGIYYKPEGSEYAIYYADTYLYITPDIFTGLMTGIFVFFVLLTGYSCLGAIQGNSVYPSKMPVLGREA